MNIFKTTDFKALANVYEPNCVSIYIPTHRANAVGDGIYKDRVTLKNQLKEAGRQLNRLKLKDYEINEYLQPLGKFLMDDLFWRHQSDGLAIFYDGNDVETYSIPKVFTPYTYVSNSFYLKPMADLIHGSGRHFIMSLSLGSVRLYEATSLVITEVGINDLVPHSMVEVVGDDYVQKHLEMRSGQGEKGGSGGMFHGHGAGSETEKKKEALKYFHEIDHGIMETLHDEDVPLVIACVDYLFPIYKEVNSYKLLKNEHISGNFEYEDVLRLKERAWEIVKDDFETDKKNASSAFNALLNEGKADSIIKEVVFSAMMGRVGSLFIKEDQEVWGRYITDRNQVEISEVRTIGDVGLLNKAAIETVNHGGTVYIVPGDEMPLKESIINAVYRY